MILKFGCKGTQFFLNNETVVTLFALIPIFEDVEGFLLFALVAEETLAVVIILNVGQYATW